MRNLELFHLMACPYSAKVRDFIEKHGLQSRIRYREIHEDERAREELTRMNGDAQVPCLVVDGEPILESDSIIQWLDRHLVSDARKAG